MDFVPNGVSLALYAMSAVCGVGLLVVWLLSNRSRRNAGFASKAHLKRQLSAKAVLRATEIRPSLTESGPDPSRTPATSLVKKRSARS